MNQIGHYKLLQRAGQGTFGEVWRAEKGGNPFALKIFKKGAPPEVFQEGKILQELNDPSWVHFVEEDLRGERPYLVTEWVEGKSLEKEKLPSDFPTILKATRQILLGLLALHRKGYVHGDLKSGNILMGLQGIKLTDLGLARPLNPSELSPVGGTLAYLAPELLFGQPASPASDFYALGVVLYRWITGSYPFQSVTVASVIRWHLFETPFHPVRSGTSMPLEFGDFILNLLAKNPSDRPSSAQVALHWLQERFPSLPSMERWDETVLPVEEEKEGFELHGEAIRFYESKKKLDDEESLILAELYYQQGYLPQALKALEGIEHSRARILKSRILTRMGSFAEALRLLEAVNAQAGELSPKDFLSYLNAQGVLEFYRGHIDASLAVFSQAESLAQEAHEWGVLASTYNNLANGILEKRETSLAERYFIRAVELARKAGDRIHEGMFQMSLGYFYHRVQRYAEALEAYGASLKILSAVGQKSEKARVLLNRANLFNSLGGLPEATQDLEEAQEIFQRRRLHYLLSYSRLIEGEAERKSGNLKRALLIFHEAEEDLEKVGRPSDALYARFHQVECLLEEKESERAGQILRRLSEESSVFQESGRSGHFHFLKGRWLWASQAPEEDVLRCFAQAEKDLKISSDPEALLHLHYVWGAFLFERHRSEEARLHLQESKERLKKLNPLLPSQWRERYQLASPLPEIERMLHSMEPITLPRAETIRHRTDSEDFFERGLQSLQKELFEELDLLTLVEKILDRMIELTHAERGFILLNEKPEPRVAVSRKIDQATLQKSEEGISGSIAHEVLEKGEPIVTVDAMEDERFSVTASIHHLKLRSILCLPFKKGEEVLGAIYLDHRNKTGAFQPVLVHHLKPFADWIAQMLLNARRFFDLSSDLQETKKKLDHAQTELKLKFDYHNIVGRHPKMLEVFQVLDRVTEIEVPILILGESGVGKELMAKAIHFNGPRRSKNFVALNCQAIPEGLFESELFGHLRGSFTGALTDRVGLVEQAHRGTLFLDEIGDMPLPLQGKLLRVLQEGRFRRLGDREEKPVDCRVLAATHRDLRALIHEGKFREDLLFRLNVVELEVPSLRERLEDLPLLLDHFLSEFSRRHGGPKRRVSAEAMALLSGYSWPGNVRELENTLMNASVFAVGDLLTPEAFRYKKELWGEGREMEVLKQEAGGWSLKVGRQRPEAGGRKREARGEIDKLSFREAVRGFEKELIERAIQESGGNITQAAQRLKVARSQLSRILKKYRVKFYE